MVESPQVTSTTGRGRGKGPAKPRKPRTRKEKVIPPAPSLDQLPVSEDCVTAGTGLLNLEGDAEINEESINLDSSTLSTDDLNLNNSKKTRGPRKSKERKPRTPKEPKVPKDTSEKPVKERKKREPKDPNAPKRRRNVKKDINEVLADTTTNYELLEKESIGNVTDPPNNQSLPNVDTEGNTQLSTEGPNLEDSNVTDFDDIPVSRIAVKDLLEEAEAKRDLVDKDDDELTNQKRRNLKKRPSSGSCKKVTPRRTPGVRKKRRGGLVPLSDGEPDDMMSTPPPSPPCAATA